MFEQAKLILR